MAAPPSNTDDTEDSSFDITSPVSFFLEKSRQQMENYLKGVLSPSTSSNQGASMILNTSDGFDGQSFLNTYTLFITKESGYIFERLFGASSS